MKMHGSDLFGEGMARAWIISSLVLENGRLIRLSDPVDIMIYVKGHSLYVHFLVGRSGMNFVTHSDRLREKVGKNVTTTC